jgi:hypothetical protein
LEVEIYGFPFELAYFEFHGLSVRRVGAGVNTGPPAVGPTTCGGANCLRQGELGWRSRGVSTHSSAVAGNCEGMGHGAFVAGWQVAG